MQNGAKALKETDAKLHLPISVKLPVGGKTRERNPVRNKRRTGFAIHGTIAWNHGYQEVANFEGLIRGALATRDAADPAIRKQIYQSSRNALNRLLEENRTLTVEAALNQQRMLEETIQHIEAGFIDTVNSPLGDHDTAAPQQHNDTTHLHPQPAELRENTAVREEPQSQNEEQAPPRVQESIAQDPLQELQTLLRGRTGQTPAPDVHEPTVRAETETDTVRNEAIIEGPEVAESQPPREENTVSVNEEDIRLHANQASAADDFVEDPAPPAGFSNRRRLQRKFLTASIVLGFLVLLGWIAYVVVVGYLDGTLLQSGTERRGTESAGTQSAQGQDSEYITIIEPGDLSSLITAGRGESEIVNQLNAEMIRVVSVRDANARGEPARPVLIKIQPGILEEIAGKSVNVEIYAKSGGNSPATFSVECQFGTLGECGRKRFRIGLQPEAVVFSVMMRDGNISGSEAYLAINTDITGTAEITGRGDALDIVYARLRPVP